MITSLKTTRQSLNLKPKLEVISEIQSRVHELSSQEDEYSKFACAMAPLLLKNLDHVRNENDLLGLIERLNSLALSQDDPEKVSIITQITSAFLQIDV